MLNHCFRDWHGPVDIERPAVGISIQMRASDNLRHLVVYRTTGQPWLCIEPASHATGALSLERMNSGKNGLRLLQPGECFHGWMELLITA